VIEANPVAEALFGYPRRELVGRPVESENRTTTGVEAA